jgi:hypothetical protein
MLAACHIFSLTLKSSRHHGCVLEQIQINSKPWTCPFLADRPPLDTPTFIIHFAELFATSLFEIVINLAHIVLPDIVSLSLLLKYKLTMTIANLPPTYVDPSHLAEAIKNDGFGVLSPTGLTTLLEFPQSSLEAIKADWNDLPPDNFLKDGGKYRRRRHSCFIANKQVITQVQHRAHYQPLNYNALHGGMLRMFEPVSEHTLAQPAWSKLLLSIARECSTIKGDQPWYIEAHQFRIDTSNGIGRPTPEGAHRDGVDFVAILLVARQNVSGGESRIFESNGRHGQRFTLSEPWELLLLDDQRVIHESTPIQPTASGGHRDTLVLTFRAGGFLNPSDLPIL